MPIESSPIPLPSPPDAGLRALELTGGHEALLQRFLEANPQYCEEFYGGPPRSTEGHDEIHDAPPKGWSYTRKWVIGWCDASGELVALANVVSDLIAPTVWHIGFFVVATSLHGTGTARRLYECLEAWMRAHGAKWLRLGVVAGNERGERFWAARGYHETRLRPETPYRKLTQTMRVLYKPLAGGTLEEYRALVPRDHPEAP